MRLADGRSTRYRSVRITGRLAKAAGATQVFFLCLSKLSPSWTGTAAVELGSPAQDPP
jgi:hypothetical protein